MRIEIDTTNSGEAEYTAAIALLASLGGRLPSHGIGQVHVDVVPHPHAASGTLTREEPDAQTLAEALLNSEAARVDTAAPPPPTDGAVVLDADGIPWDARIHAGTKTQTKGKTWTKLRNVNEVLYGEVHAELQERYAGQAPNDSTSTGTTGAGSAHGGDAGADPAAPPPPADEPAPPPPGNDAAGSAPTGQENAGNAGTAGGRFADFPGFVQGVNAIRTPPIPYLELNTFAQAVGVAGGFKDMKDHPELWETFFGLAGGQ